MSATNRTPEDLALAKKNRFTLLWMSLMVFGLVSLSWFCKEALYPIFFKY